MLTWRATAFQLTWWLRGKISWNKNMISYRVPAPSAQLPSSVNLKHSGVHSQGAGEYRSLPHESSVQPAPQPRTRCKRISYHSRETFRVLTLGLGIVFDFRTALVGVVGAMGSREVACSRDPLEWFNSAFGFLLYERFFFVGVSSSVVPVIVVFDAVLLGGEASGCLRLHPAVEVCAGAIGGSLLSSALKNALAMREAWSPSRMEGKSKLAGGMG